MSKHVVARCGSGVCLHARSSEAFYRLPRGPGLPSLYRDRRNSEAEIRFYYIASVKWKEDPKSGLYQCGCGLNLLGGYATLCACKLTMLKTIHRILEQSGKKPIPIYVGVLGATLGRRPNSKITPLVFLGKVDRSFDSFLELWMYLPRRVRHAKDVRLHALGDLYPPNLVRKFKEHRPIRFAEGFVHADGSYKSDIKKSCPAVFKEWQAWPDADVGFTDRDENDIALTERAKFRKMIAVPRQSANG